MKCLKTLFLLAMLIALLIIAISATPEKEEEHNNAGRNDQLDETEEPSSLEGEGRFLAQRRPRGVLTCDRYPRVCRVKGSPGPDCCKKRCVNVDRDRLNCGKCGRRCKYLEICCRGECVNPSSNRRHCGGCGNKCKKGSLCVYGMCSYA